MSKLSKDRIYRSVPLTKDDIRSLKKWIKDECRGLHIDAAEKLGVTRTTLRSLLAVKSCSQKTYDKVQSVIVTIAA